MIHVVSVRVGTLYGPEYVTSLHDGICRHLGEDQRHYCLTDAPEELPEGVEAIPHNPDLPGWWAKIGLFSPDMPWEDGDEILADLRFVVIPITGGKQYHAALGVRRRERLYRRSVALTDTLSQGALLIFG